MSFFARLYGVFDQLSYHHSMLEAEERLLGMSRKPKVVVVGAGTAGLAAAYTLLKKKDELEVIVLEAADHPGGRMAGDEIDGFYIDTAATMFLESYDTVRRLAEDLGVPLKRVSRTKGGQIHSNGEFHPVFRGGSLKERLLTARTLLSLRVLSLKGIWQFLRFVKILKARSKDFNPEDPTRFLDLDTPESFADFAKANSLEEFVDSLARNDINCFTTAYTDQVSAACGMALLWIFSFNPSSNLMVPEKGVGSFATALAQACSENTRLSTPVERIVLEEGSVKGIMTKGGEFIEADAVICATTATVASRIIPDLPSDISSVLSRVSYSAALNVAIGLGPDILREGAFAATFSRSSGTWLSALSNIKIWAPKAMPDGKNMLHVLVIADEAKKLFPLSDSEIEERIVAEIRRFLPAMPEQPELVRVYRWHEAGCIYHGGMMKAIHQMRRQSLPSVKGLYLAGDYMNVPVTNGAMRSGVDAAKDCMSFVSQRIA